MNSAVMRGAAALPGSEAISRAKGTCRNLGSPVGACGEVARGGSGKGQPKPLAELRRGGGSGCSTDDGGEGNEPTGGKAPTREESGRVGEGPDTGPGFSASQTCPGERGGATIAPDPLHGAAAPCGRRSAPASVPAATKGSQRRDGWGNGGGLRAEPGCKYPGPLRPGSHRAISATAGAPNHHPEGRRRAAAPRHTGIGGSVVHGSGDGAEA